MGRQGGFLDLIRAALCICLMSAIPEGVTSIKLHRVLGVTQRSAWRMAKRISERWWGLVGIQPSPET